MGDFPSQSVASPEATSPGAPPSSVGRFRWIICTVLLLGVTKNYVDRLAIGLLKPTLQHQLGWSEIDYGNLVFVFTASYAIGMVVMGRIIDWLGTRVGYALSMVAWSMASMAHGLATSLPSFFAVRGGLGFAEAGVFPASLKAVSEWFPTRERALAAGIFNAGTNVGAIVTPLIVPWITIRWGWRAAFLLIGSSGFLWVALWLWIYRRPEKHTRCSRRELQYIQDGDAGAGTTIHWIKLLRYRQTWAFVAGKFLTDPIWYFYLFWVPDFLYRKHSLNLLDIGLPLVVVYLIADGGSVAGGWLSSSLIHHGSSVNRARKFAMLACALAVIPIVSASHVSSTWSAVLILGLATASHQGFSANLLTLPADMFPSQAVASVIGMGGMSGAIGGMLIAKLVAYLLQVTGSYAVPFALASSAYLIALATIHLLAPQLAKAKMESK